MSAFYLPLSAVRTKSVCLLFAFDLLHTEQRLSGLFICKADKRLAYELVPPMVETVGPTASAPPHGVRLENQNHFSSVCLRVTGDDAEQLVTLNIFLLLDAAFW